MSVAGIKPKKAEKAMADSLLDKLEKMSDEEFLELELYPDFDFS